MRVIKLQYDRWGFRWMNGPLLSFDTKEQAEEALHLMLKTINTKNNFVQTQISS